MDLNISPQIDWELEKEILPALIKIMGWKRIDCSALEGPIPGFSDKFFMVIYPTLVSYLDKGNVVEVWHKCRITVMDSSDAKVKDVAQYLKKSVFPKLPFAPFKDEDAKFGYFSLKEHRGYKDLSFFLNPSYPEGIWSNHAIEDA